MNDILLRQQINDIFLSPIRLNELETLIQNSVRKVLNERQKQSSKELHDLIGIKEMSQFLGISIAGIYGKVHDRTIPFIKRTGVKKLYFSREAILKWLNEGKQDTRSEIKEQAKKSLEKK